MDTKMRDQLDDIWSRAAETRLVRGPMVDRIIVPQEEEEETVQAQPPKSPRIPQPVQKAGSELKKKTRKFLSKHKRELIVGGAAVATAGAGYGVLQYQAWQREQAALRQEASGKWPGWHINSSTSQIPNHVQLPVETQIGHLLRRAGFGATAAEIKKFAKMGYTATVDYLLDYSKVSDDAMENQLRELGLDLTRTEDMQRWWLLRMAWTQRPLLEKMTLFWHGHFTSSYRNAGNRENERMGIQNQFLREHAFDTFDNLLLGITADPAMLYYLDLTKSYRDQPNENYARELMELFTLGIGHYTQQDVYEAAVALTGWHVFGDSLVGTYVEDDHNQRNKTFLGQSGNLNYKDVIKILTNHKATPWFIARKLFTYFVYEQPANSDLEPLVEAYVTSNHSMKAVMRALLLSPQFFSERAYRGRVKSPVEFIAGTYRALQMSDDAKDLPQYTGMMGQELFNPPNVAGWPGNKIGTLWLNSGTWMARLSFIDRALHGGNRGYPPMDLQAFIDTNNIGSPEHFVDFFGQFLLDGHMPSDRRTQLLNYFKGTDDTTPYQFQIVLKRGQKFPLNRVRGTLYLMLSAPEYLLN